MMNNDDYRFNHRLTLTLDVVLIVLAMLLTAMNFFMFGSNWELPLAALALFIFLFWARKKHIIISFRDDRIVIRPGPLSGKIVKAYDEIQDVTRQKVRKSEAWKMQFTNGSPVYLRQDVLSANDWTQLSKRMATLEAACKTT